MNSALASHPTCWCHNSQRTIRSWRRSPIPFPGSKLIANTLSHGDENLVKPNLGVELIVAAAQRRLDCAPLVNRLSGDDAHTR
jgi:hypothetical protein